MKYNPQPGWWLWWDTGCYSIDWRYTGSTRIHRDDGTRHRHRINYWEIPLLPEFRDIPGILSQDPAVQLKARKLLWRRLRSGYYDRNYNKHIPEPPTRWDNCGNKIIEPEPVPRCWARCKDGHRCRARVVVNKFTGKQSRRCKWHGGHATGPRTAEGRARALAALARGRENRWHRAA
jgi:hypothetical protein